MSKEQKLIDMGKAARQLRDLNCQSIDVDIEDIIAIVELAEERQADNSRLREDRAGLSREANELEERLKGQAQPIGFIDPASLKEYRGKRIGGSWSAEPKDGEYNQTLPIFLQAAPAPQPEDYFATLVAKARVAADKAMKKFPQPNYVLNKVSEEHGEVIKGVVHYLEGRETWDHVESELVDNLAMLIRLVVEGDQVIGFTPPESVINHRPAASAAEPELKPLEWSEQYDPNEDIRYNHVIADSVLGRFSIEWKGWKEYDSRCLYLAGEYIDSFHSVDEAKAGAAAHLLKIYNSLAAR